MVIDYPEVMSEYEARRVERMLAQLFLGHLHRDETLRVEGGHDSDWVALRWTLQRGVDGRCYAVDARVARQRGPRVARDAVVRDRELLQDVLADLFDGYLRGERTPFTGPKWERVEFAGRELWLRGQELDPGAEAAADALLHAAASSDGSAAASLPDERLP